MRAEGGSARQGQGGGEKRRAREARRDAGTGSLHTPAVLCAAEESGELRTELAPGPRFVTFERNYEDSTMLPEAARPETN